VVSNLMPTERLQISAAMNVTQILSLDDWRKLEIVFDENFSSETFSSELSTSSNSSSSGVQNKNCQNFAAAILVVTVVRILLQ
jgi:hypothetical protein